MSNSGCCPVFTFRRIFSCLGFGSDFSSNGVEEKVAETEILVCDREKTLSAIDEHACEFAHKVASVKKTVKESKDEIEQVLEHIKEASKTTADARSLLEKIVANRKEKPASFE